MRFGPYYQGKNPFGSNALTYHPRMARQFETRDEAEQKALELGVAWTVMSLEDALKRTRL